jgi:hypothetical protein
MRPSRYLPLKTIGIGGQAWQRDKNGKIWMYQASGKTSRDKHKSQKKQCKDSSTTYSRYEDDIPQASRCYCGWSAQGIACYKQLFDDIKEEQTKPSFLDLETYLMEEF